MPNDSPSAEIVAAARSRWSQTDQTHWLPVAGSSMEPLLRAGDEVLVAHGFGALRRGDVVVLGHAGGLLAHRVLVIRAETDPAAIWTQGDHNACPDPVAASDTILGRVTTVRRAGCEISIDTPRWQVAGWLIATSQITLNGLSLGVGPLARPRRLAARAGRRLLAGFRAVICR